MDDIIAFKKLPGMAHAKIPFIAKIGCFQSLENFDQILSEVGISVFLFFFFFFLFLPVVGELGSMCAGCTCGVPF